jgi:hypothetical protein
MTQVPIELGMRRRKLREVGVMTWASTLAMLARAVWRRLAIGRATVTPACVVGFRRPS